MHVKKSLKVLGKVPTPLHVPQEGPYDIFVNCNWVVTRWQYTFTHKQYIEQYKTTILWREMLRLQSQYCIISFLSIRVPS